MRYNWIQPGLIKRSEKNNPDRFKNLVFFGRSQHIADELRGNYFKNKLKKIGINFDIVTDFNKWQDYSNVDGVVAVRSFSKKKYFQKPAAKLINSWAANVICFINPESSVTSELTRNNDILICSTIDELLEKIIKISNSTKLRRFYINSGKKRFKNLFNDPKTNDWNSLIDNVIIPHSKKWNNTNSIQRELFYFNRKCFYKFKIFEKKIINFLNHKFGFAIEQYPFFENFD